MVSYFSQKLGFGKSIIWTKCQPHFLDKIRKLFKLRLLNVLDLFIYSYFLIKSYQFYGICIHLSVQDNILVSVLKVRKTISGIFMAFATMKNLNKSCTFSLYYTY